MFKALTITATLALTGTASADFDSNTWADSLDTRVVRPAPQRSPIGGTIALLVAAAVVGRRGRRR